MKLFFYDLETTGTNPARHGIHQISGKIVIDGKEMETFDYHVQPNPKAQIEPKALEVGGGDGGSNQGISPDVGGLSADHRNVGQVR